MSTTIDPTIPTLAADWLDTHQWVQSAGDGVTSGCLTTATIIVRGQHPGDQYIWRAIERHRGVAEEFNDADGRTKAEVIAALRSLAVPDAAEMVAVFGPQWEAVRDLVRRCAALTSDEVQRLGAARGAARGVACDVAWALVVRDLIGQHGFTQEHYDTLTRPWATVIGPAHPDDAAVTP